MQNRVFIQNDILNHLLLKRCIQINTRQKSSLYLHFTSTAEGAYLYSVQDRKLSAPFMHIKYGDQYDINEVNHDNILSLFQWKNVAKDNFLSR